MSQNVGSIHYDLTLNTKDFENKANKVGSKLKEIGTKMQDTGKKMTMRLTLPIVAGAGYAVKAANDLGESINAVRVVFGKASKTVLDFSKDAAKSAGMSQRAFNQAVTPIGAMLRNMGLSAQEAANQAVKLGQRAADMASIFNTDVSDALGAVAAGLRGEADPLERFGVSLKETALQAYALKEGMISSGEQMTEQQKTTARLGLLYEQTNRFAGDFVNTSDQLANKSRITKAELENAAASLGTKLMPHALRIVQIFSEWISKFNNLSSANQDFIIKLASVAAAVGPLVFLLGSVARAITSISNAVRLLYLHPLVLAFAAVVAGGYFLVQRLKEINQESDGVTRVLKRVELAARALPPPFGLVAQLIANIGAKMRGQIAASREVKSALDAQRLATNQLSDAQLNAKGSSLAVERAQRTYNEAVKQYGPKSLEAREAAYGLKVAQQNLKDANNRVKDSLNNVKSAQNNLGKSVRDTSGAVKAQGRDAGVLSNFWAIASNNIISAAKKAWGWLQKLNPFHKESPSLIDWITRGTRQMVALYSQAFGKIGAMATLTKPVLNSYGVPSNNTTINGNINIASQQDAHYLLEKMNRNVALEIMGVSPA